MPKTNLKSKLIFPMVITFAFFALAGQAEAAIFVDNAASGCANGATTYNPANRTCLGGNNTVYTSLTNANNGIGSPANEGQRITVNIRASNPNTNNKYTEKINIYKSYTTWQKYSADAQKPFITGNWGQVDHNWLGLITTTNTTGVVIDGLEVGNTGYEGDASTNNNGFGIQTEGATSVIIKNCYLHHTGRAGIYLNNSNIVTIENNELYETDYTYLEYDSTSWNGAIHAYSTNNVTIKNNTLHGIGGEGMNLARWGENYTIENNILFDIRRPFIFINQIRNVVCRYNLLYHTRTRRYLGANGGSASGITLGREEWWGEDYTGYGVNIDVYGNMVARLKKGIHIFGRPNPAGGYWKASNIRIHNNTVIESWDSLVPFYSLEITDQALLDTTVTISNNIFQQTDGTIALVGDPAIFANNLWSKAPDADAQSASDLAYSIPRLAKSTGWLSLVPNQLSTTDFNLTSQSTAIDSGAWLTTITTSAGTGASFIVADAGYFRKGDQIRIQNATATTTITSISGNTITVANSQDWRNGNTGVSMTYSGTKPDVGAREYAGGGDTMAPNAPAGLLIR